MTEKTTSNNQTLIEQLQKINNSVGSEKREELIQEFKNKYPNNLDWLDFFEENSSEKPQITLSKIPQIEGFEVIKSLGSGASGKVYLANQQKPNRQVAIKLAMQYLSEEQLHRFQHESLLLSRLSHPNIAQLYQSGIVAGEDLPYIVMEYVDGVTIYQYCQNNKLSTQQIIELFNQVLEAVQYAHNKGIVHRDIKPENVLVNKEGVVKLLDFGIALATLNSTQQLTQLTKTGEIVGTLAYMSPEQVSGQDNLDTRADVYSLGVVLYQLLCNALPHQLDSSQIFLAISKIIEDLPIKLHAQNSTIDADLSTIVHHALEKNPDHRYQAPRDFKADLNNWLKGDAISIKHNTLWHSIKHISKKHKALVTGSILAVLGLLTGLVFAVSFALKEQEARKIAESNALTSLKTVEFINELFSSADPENLYGEKLTLLHVLNNAETTLVGQLNGQETVEANIRLTLAGVFISIGQHEKSQQQLNHVSQLFPFIKEDAGKVDMQYTHALIQSSINLYNNKYEEDGKFVKDLLKDPRFKDKDTLEPNIQLSHGLLMLGKLDEALTTINLAIEDSQDMDESNNDLLFAQVIKAMIFDKMGKFEESKAINEKVIAIRKQNFGENHPRTLSAVNNLAAVENNLGNFDKAQELMAQVIDGKTKMIGASHLSTLISRTNLLSFYVKRSELEKADAYSQELLKELNETVGPLHKYTLVVNNIRAYLLEDLDQLEAAEDLYRQTLQNYQDMGKNSGTELLVLQSNLAMLLMKQEKYQESDAIFQQLLANVETSMSKEHVYYAIFIGNYGELLTKMKRFDEAQSYLQLSYESILKTFGESHERTIKAKKRLETLPTINQS